MVAASGSLEMIDVEVAESWYPILIEFKRVRPGAFGSGAQRSGAGCNMAYHLHGSPMLFGVMLAMRERLPLVGMAGGFPGAVTEFVMHHADRPEARVGGHSMDTTLLPGHTFEFRCASGGGYGDPLDRAPDLVARDVKLGRVTRDEAANIYGVVVDTALHADAVATSAQRAALLRRRLDAASPALHPLGADHSVPPGPVYPLYPGVEQRGNVAVSTRSGAPLAVAPAHFTDGCPVLDERHEFPSGPAVIYRAYLDPGSGHALVVDVVPDGAPRAFTTLPRRWRDA
jgi:N-methylhydantoinase B